MNLSELVEYIYRPGLTDLLRVEALDFYESAGDHPHLERRCAGQPIEMTDARRSWLDRIREHTENGTTPRRVHVVTETLNEYLRFECDVHYQANTAAGEQVRILALPAEQVRGVPDLYVVNGEHVALMHYGDDGRFVSAEDAGVATRQWVETAASCGRRRRHSRGGGLSDRGTTSGGRPPPVTGGDVGGLDELSRTLRGLRQAADLSLESVAEQTGFSVAKISRIETGKTVPSPGDVEVMLAVPGYRADRATRQRLVELATDAKTTSRRIVLTRPTNRAAFQARLGRLDSQHQRIVEFNPVMVPGLLQTADYARAVFTGISSEEITQAIGHRLARQAILNDPDRDVTVLLTEGALGWAVLPPAVMIQQLDHISRATETSRARIGVIPLGVRSTMVLSSGWTLWGDQVALPSVLATQVVLNPPHVAPYVTRFEKLAGLAVYGDEARTVLRTVAERYRTM
jgi:transcriptional regulator with XRE-family HTH domain